MLGQLQDEVAQEKADPPALAEIEKQADANLKNDPNLRAQLENGKLEVAQTQQKVQADTESLIKSKADEESGKGFSQSEEVENKIKLAEEDAAKASEHEGFLGKLGKLGKNL